MDRNVVWEICSYAWTEIGIDDEECRRLVKKGDIRLSDLDAVNRIIFRDVCASFAVESFLVFPLMLWMLMPDWGFDAEYLRKRIERWYAAPYARHFLNPVRLPGYVVSLLFVFSYWLKLRRAVRHAGS